MTYQQEIDRLLKLIDSPVDGQRLHLAVDGIIRTGEDGVSGAAYLEESFADLAFRLRDETIEMVKPVGHLGLAWVDAVCEVIQYCEGRKYCKECGQEHNTKKLFDWSRDAQPIHWIVAALILQEMLQKEMREH